MAMALWQNLTDRGIDVFYDIESIDAGYFEKIILSQIAARPYMVRGWRLMSCRATPLTVSSEVAAVPLGVP